ncbi:MAG: IS1380 family transposase [Acidiferrobacterales bacterium]
MPKPPFIWERGDEDLTAQGGLGVVGMLFGSLPLGERLNASTVPGAQNPDISHRDVVAAYVGLLAQGKNDFDHIEAFREDPFFQISLGLQDVPSSPTLRQRLDQAAAAEEQSHWNAALVDSTDELLKRHARCEPIQIGKVNYIPLDIDVSPFDNSKTKKEGVSRTYKGCDGFAPIFSYLGHEGYGLDVEFREGKQHSQKNTPQFLRQSLRRARGILPAARFLARMDSGNDSADNIDVCLQEGADFLIKRNLRKERPEDWLERARREATAKTPRDGKTVYRGDCHLAPKMGHAPVRVVYEIVERTITARGQHLLAPEIEVASYWTSLTDPVDEILPWYPDHGTMEQFHSEYKTDLDLERLPSGKFATNQLVLSVALLTFNILRIMGQATLGDPAVPLRKSAQRRRIRTVIQNLIICAARLVRHARGRWVRYAPHNPWGVVLAHLYAGFA